MAALRHRPRQRITQQQTANVRILPPERLQMHSKRGRIVGKLQEITEFSVNVSWPCPPAGSV